jgi:hypothetical protein
MKKTFFLKVAILMCAMVFTAMNMAYSAAYTAVQDGAWNEAATWDVAGMPGAGDDVTINDLDITIPAGYSAECANLFIGGTTVPGPPLFPTTSLTADAGATALNVSGTFEVTVTGDNIPVSVDLSEAANVAIGDLVLPGALSATIFTFGEDNTISGSLTQNGWTIEGVHLTLNGNNSFDGNLTLSGNLSASGNTITFGATSDGNITGNVTAGGIDNSSGGDLDIGGGVTISSMLDGGGNTTVGGSVTCSSGNQQIGGFTVTGALKKENSADELEFTGDVTVGELVLSGNDINNLLALTGGNANTLALTNDNYSVEFVNVENGPSISAPVEPVNGTGAHFDENNWNIYTPPPVPLSTAGIIIAFALIGGFTLYRLRRNKAWVA